MQRSAWQRPRLYRRGAFDATSWNQFRITVLLEGAVTAPPGVMNPRISPPGVMSKSRRAAGGPAWKFLTSAMAGPNEKVGRVRTGTTSNPRVSDCRGAHRPLETTGGDAARRGSSAARISCRSAGTARRTPCRAVLPWPSRPPRPSGEKIASVGVDDSTALKRDVRVRAVHVQRVIRRSLLTLKSSVSPFGDHDSGTCASPGAGLVRRSTAPVPSAFCRNIAGAPSRVDWNTICRLSAVQTGYRLRPCM